MKETFQIKKPEIPMGEEGKVKVVEVVDNSLLSALPLHDYQGRFLKPSAIVAATLPEMIRMEEEDKPMEEILLARALLLAGVPEEYLRSLCYAVSQEAPFYVRNQFSQDPQLFFWEEHLAKFSSKDPTDRFDAALLLGRPLIHINLNLIVDSFDIPDNLRAHTRLLMKDYLDNILLGRMRVKFANIADQKKIDDASDMIKSLMDDETPLSKPRFVSAGGAMKLVLFGQTLKTAEYTMGIDFHTDTYCYLSQPVLQKFLDSIAWYNRGFRRPIPPSQVAEKANRVRPILVMLGLNSREQTVDPYQRSELQLLYVQSDHPKVNKWKALE